MAKTVAKWNGKIIAESDHCIAVEGNAYFPPDSIKKDFLTSSTHTSMCPWKGEASYMNVMVDGKSIANVAWVYRAPKAAATPIKDYVAFWKGVEVTGASAAVPMK